MIKRHRKRWFDFTTAVWMILGLVLGMMLGLAAKGSSVRRNNEKIVKVSRVLAVREAKTRPGSDL